MKSVEHHRKTSIENTIELIMKITSNRGGDAAVISKKKRSGRAGDNKHILIGRDRSDMIYNEYIEKNIRHLRMLTPDIKSNPPSLLQRRFNLESSLKRNNIETEEGWKVIDRIKRMTTVLEDQPLQQNNYSVRSKDKAIVDNGLKIEIKDQKLKKRLTMDSRGKYYVQSDDEKKHEQIRSSDTQTETNRQTDRSSRLKSKLNNELRDSICTQTERRDNGVIGIDQCRSTDSSRDNKSINNLVPHVNARAQINSRQTSDLLQAYPSNYYAIDTKLRKKKSEDSFENLIAKIGRQTGINNTPEKIELHRFKLKLNRNFLRSSRERGPLTVRTIKDVLSYSNGSPKIQVTSKPSESTLNKEIWTSTSLNYRSPQSRRHVMDAYLQ